MTGSSITATDPRVAGLEFRFVTTDSRFDIDDMTGRDYKCRSDRLRSSFSG